MYSKIPPDQGTNYVVLKNTPIRTNKTPNLLYHMDSDVIICSKSFWRLQGYETVLIFQELFSEVKASWRNYAEETYYYLEDLVLISFIKSHHDNCSKIKDV